MTATATAKRYTLSQSMTGFLKINGKPASEKINGFFRMTTDSLQSWRKDDKDRFEYLMIEAGLANEAKVILSAANA